MQRELEFPLLIAALLTIPAIAIDQSDVGPAVKTVGAALNWFLWLAFVLEAGVMLHLVDDRRSWIRHHPLEVAVVILTPPFLPSSLQAARAFRLLRLLRLVRLGVLARRLLSTEGVRDAAVLATMVVLGGGAGFSTVEKSQDLSAWDGVWWAVSTVTTVGYGDIAPRTDAGRVIAVVVMLVGIGFIAILTAAAAERFLRAQRDENRELKSLERRLDQVLHRLDQLER